MMDRKPPAGDGAESMETSSHANRLFTGLAAVAVLVFAGFMLLVISQNFIEFVVAAAMIGATYLLGTLTLMVFGDDDD
jgi:hypothetical protein